MTEQQLEWLEPKTPNEIIDELINKYNKNRFWVLYSGGKDSTNRLYDPKGISRTLRASAGGKGSKTGLYKTVEGIRRLTPLECERLQGFPDEWTEGVSDTQRYKQLGNAVTVPVVEFIARRFEN